MEALLSRYRNLTVLLVVVAAQLLYLAYQVKTSRDERLIRVWAVTAVTPMAGAVEGIRRNTIGFLQDYFILLDVREQNRKLKADNDQLRMENVYFRNQLRTAEHASALMRFQAQAPSKTVAARVIGNSTVATAKAVFIDRGSTSAVEKGMAVVTPEGIVGKVVAVYPLVSQVLLITDPTFKVGVESQKGHVHGVLNCGAGKCSIEQIQNEDRVSPGEWFFTSGEDRIFPKGFPVGTAVSVQPGQGMKEVKLNLSGAPGGAEEVLVVLQGVHQPIPAAPVAEDEPIKTLPPPPAEGADIDAQAVRPQTEADKIREKYDALGKEQNHVYGSYTSSAPNFNLKPASDTTHPAPKSPEAQPASAADGGTGGSAASKPLAHPQSAATGPVLPLGAPRHRSAPSSTQPQPAPQQ
jgi:rod shape-determining protein MreC